MSKSNSSIKDLPLSDRIRGWISLARLSRADARNIDFTNLRTSFAMHDGFTRKYLGKPFTECKVIEIGYGARPNRLVWFAGMGVDVIGIDLDQPLIRGSIGEFFSIYRRNGGIRALKSVGRWLINERHFRKAMLAELSKERGELFAFPAERLAVGDAAGEAFWANHKDINYIFSEDVFEHIPAASIDPVLAMMAARMSPDGIAYVKPLIFTGITGGHHIEWFSGTFKRGPHKRVTEPWEHLRQKRHPADTYLNGLSRAEYREKFLHHFEILEEKVVNPDLGREYLTPEVRAELSAYSEDELFSNIVIFILRPRPR